MPGGDSEFIFRVFFLEHFVLRMFSERIMELV